MAHNISGTGQSITLTASKTFPAGFTITALSDDTNPFSVKDVEIAGTAVGLNGDLISWAKPASIEVTLSVIAGSEDDRNLTALLVANKPSRVRPALADVITMTRVNADGSADTLANGRIISGPPVSSVTKEGRMSAKSFKFVFESFLSV